MRLLFLALNASYSHTSLSARYIRAACENEGINVVVVESNINERVERVTHQVAGKRPSVVLCSVYIWNRRHMDDISTRLKLMYPNLKIIWGGPEVEYNPSEVLAQHTYIDALCLGEGEVVVPQLAKALLEGKELEKVPGVVTRSSTELLHPRTMELDQLPDPYHGEALTPNKLYYFETSRGCPYNCAYCLSSASRGVRFMSVPQVQNRVGALAQKMPLVKFVDRTFNADRARSRLLWEYMLNLPGECRFHFEICAHLLEEQDFELLAQPSAARFQFEVGLQSTYEPALAAINRPMDTDRLLANVARLVALRTVEVHLDLIAGLPGEDKNSFIHTFDQAISARPHRLHLGFLKLLPGTSLKRDATQHGYAYLPYAPYEVLRSNALSAEDFLELKNLEHKLNLFYNANKSGHSIHYALDNMLPSHLFSLLPTDSSHQHIHQTLLESLQSQITDLNRLTDLLRFDFLLSEPHRLVPAELHYGPGDEDKILRDIVYSPEGLLEKVLPHRRGEKPGTVLRSLRLGYFRPSTLQNLGQGESKACIFDYSMPQNKRAFPVPTLS